MKTPAGTYPAGTAPALLPRGRAGARRVHQGVTCSQWTEGRMVVAVHRDGEYRRRPTERPRATTAPGALPTPAHEQASEEYGVVDLHLAPTRKGSNTHHNLNSAPQPSPETPRPAILARYRVPRPAQVGRHRIRALEPSKRNDRTGAPGPVPGTADTLQEPRAVWSQRGSKHGDDVSTAPPLRGRSLLLGRKPEPARLSRD